ncbi:hypothetical protein FF38_09027 [Lucilia cuprina]|uniref:Uncharacterized protein n=1 Tax=Lucilia cuprina TaxID=7375 RepID=A0A0L0BLI7_LUCCU|nr:hypothetical protein FF38_09027 [Lucilia cuprina]
MKFIILLAIVVAATANLLQYTGYNYDNYNVPGINYPSYNKPLVYHHHNNYVVKPQSPPQYPNSNVAVCATYNGIWKTFSNIYQFKDEINQGLAWNFHSYGTCPKSEKPLPEAIEPICATYKNQLRTFANALALEVDNLINGKNWVKLFNGVCPHISEPITTTTAVPFPSTPCGNQPVCGVLNGVWKTFPNLNELNAEIAKGSGWSFYSFGFCPKPEVCAKFEDEFRTFSSALALEVEKIVSGKNWVIVASGVCLNTPTPSPATPTPSTPTTTPSTPTTTPNTTTSTPATNTPPASVEDNDFSISTTDTTEASTNKMSTTPSDSDSDKTTSKYSTSNPPDNVDDTAATLTTPSGCQTNHRIQQNNNYHGPYVEGSFHYNHNMFNQANIKPYHSKKY